MNEREIRELTTKIEKIAMRKNLCNKLLHEAEYVDHKHIVEESKKLGKTLHTLFNSLDYETLDQVQLKLLDDMDELKDNEKMMKVYDRLDLQIGTYLKKKFTQTNQSNIDLVM